MQLGAAGCHEVKVLKSSICRRKQAICFRQVFDMQFAHSEAVAVGGGYPVMGLPVQQNTLS